MSILQSRECPTGIPWQKSSHPLAKNKVTCLPHQTASKEMLYNWLKLTVIQFLRLAEAPVKHTASQSFNKILFH